jgi:hypothetical protein
MIVGWETVAFFVMAAVAIPVGVWIVVRWMSRRRMENADE